MTTFFLRGLVLILTSSVYHTAVQGACPEVGGFELFSAESCYSFRMRENTWNDAEVDCVRSGARLAKIETLEENEFLRSYLSNNSRTFYGFDLWLGGKRNSDGMWFWADNSPITDEGFDDWQEGKPALLTRDSVCLEFEAEFGIHWNDDYCADLNHYICERPFNPPTPPSSIVRKTSS